MVTGGGAEVSGAAVSVTTGLAVGLGAGEDVSEVGVEVKVCNASSAELEEVTVGAEDDEL